MTKYMLFEGISKGKVAIDRLAVWGMEEVTVQDNPCTVLLTGSGGRLTVAQPITDVLELIENYDEKQYQKQKEEWAERHLEVQRCKQKLLQAEEEAGHGKAQSRRSELIDGKRVVTLTYEPDETDALIVAKGKAE